MKLSSETMTILKNFATINQSILFKEGKIIKTISPQKTVMAMAEVSDDFSRQFGIYSLPKFISACSLFQNPELKFNDNHLQIIDGKQKANYVYADPSMIITPPEKEIKLPSVDVSVEVTSADINKIMKGASAFQLPEIAFVGENGTCYLRAIDSSTQNSDYYGVELGETEDTFCLIIKSENLQILPLDYKVELSSKGISKFSADNVTYFIAIESKSTYQKGN
jgi:hypothetical protein